MEVQESIFDYSTAKNQDDYSPIPEGTIVKVKFTIKKGDYNNEEHGWTDGLATLGQSGAVYLNTINTVLTGEHKNKKIYHLIGLYSPKGPTYEEMGKSYIKAVLDSAYGLEPNDMSEEARKKRSKKRSELEGLVHLVEVKTTHDHKGNLKNEIKKVITPNDIRYGEAMGVKIEDDFDDEIPWEEEK
jgi:hypothetical protein